jgi:multidrug efflux pump subunit AcrA (membrane-fusion protein)
MKRFLSKLFALAIFFGVIGAIAYYLLRNHAPTVIGADLGVVEKLDLEQRVTIAGSVVPRRRTLVAAPYDGYVKKMYVKVGDTVRANDPLVSVVQSLQSSEEVFPLRAPYAGTIVFVQRYEGEAVKANDLNDFLLRVDDLSKLYVSASAPEVDRTKLKVGQEALIRASAVPDRPYKGVITELTLAPRDNANNYGGQQQSDYPVRIEITERDKQIGPGMSVVIDIITDRRKNVLTLRNEYVLKEREGYSVTMADGSHREIKVGMQNEEAYEIVSGLKEGEKVKMVDFTELPESL